MSFSALQIFSQAPTEAKAYLGGVVALVGFIFVFFLYVNKRLCFLNFNECCHNSNEKESKNSKRNMALEQKHLQHKRSYNTLQNGENTNRDDQENFITRVSNNNNDQMKKLHNNNNNYINGFAKSVKENIDQSPSAVKLFSPPNQSKRPILVPSSSFDQSKQTILVKSSSLDQSKCPVLMTSPSASSLGSVTSGDESIHRTLRHRDYRRHFSPDRINRSRISDELWRSGETTKRGMIEAGFSYDLPTKLLTVHVLQAKDFNQKIVPPNTLVRLVVMPVRKQRQKTKVKSGENPHFNEAFVFNKINPDEISQLGIRLRLCSCEKFKREIVIGETIVPLNNVNVGGVQNNFWLTLETRAAMFSSQDDSSDIMSLPRSESSESNTSAHGAAPELLVGLNYNGTTGQLTVEIVRGSHFRHLTDRKMQNSHRLPDTFVRLTVTSSSGYPIASTKSSVRRGQPSPLYKEKFIFPVPLFQLQEVTLLVSVYAKRSIQKKVKMGYFSLGFHSSGNDQLLHWEAMREKLGEQICRWHSLLPPF